jgi:hypothetical protein
VISVIDRTIQSYIDDERKRTVALARKISGGLLIYCIENSYSVSEIATARERYEQSKPVVDTEDLM